MKMRLLIIIVAALTLSGCCSLFDRPECHKWDAYRPGKNGTWEKIDFSR